MKADKDADNRTAKGTRTPDRGNFRLFLERPAMEKVMLLEAAVLLAVARSVTALVPFERTAAWLGVADTESPPEMAGEADRETARRIGWAVRTASIHVPFDAACLPQAMAARSMLRRRGIACTVYFGVRPDEVEGTDRPSVTDGLAAHAWVRAGPCFVTGGEEAGGFTVVSTYS